MPTDIRELEPGDYWALVGFFQTIASDTETTRFFHPHSFDHCTADRIAHRRGIRDDCYFGAFEGTDMIAYGMLRGWDEGYSVPAFGICVLPTARGRGVGSDMLKWAITTAITRGSTKLMLKVYPENVSAVRLYERIGFVLSSYPEDPAQWIGYLDLSCTAVEPVMTERGPECA